MTQRAFSPAVAAPIFRPLLRRLSRLFAPFGDGLRELEAHVQQQFEKTDILNGVVSVRRAAVYLTFVQRFIPVEAEGVRPVAERFCDDALLLKLVDPLLQRARCSAKLSCHNVQRRPTAGEHEKRSPSLPKQLPRLVKNRGNFCRPSRMGHKRRFGRVGHIHLEISDCASATPVVSVVAIDAHGCAHLIWCGCHDEHHGVVAHRTARERASSGDPFRLPLLVCGPVVLVIPKSLGTPIRRPARDLGKLRQREVHKFRAVRAPMSDLESRHANL